MTEERARYHAKALARSMGVREAAAGYAVILDQIYEALIAELASVNEKVKRSHAGAGSSRNR